MPALNKNRAEYDKFAKAGMLDSGYFVFGNGRFVAWQLEGKLDEMVRDYSKRWKNLLIAKGGNEPEIIYK